MIILLLDVGATFLVGRTSGDPEVKIWKWSGCWFGLHLQIR